MGSFGRRTSTVMKFVTSRRSRITNGGSLRRSNNGGPMPGTDLSSTWTMRNVSRVSNRATWMPTPGDGRELGNDGCAAHTTNDRDPPSPDNGTVGRKLNWKRNDTRQYRCA